MLSRSLSKSKSFSLKKELRALGLNKLSKEVGFEARKPRKISSRDLIIGFFDCSCTSAFSLLNWALHVGHLSGKTVSKQAIAGRINDRFILLLEELLGSALGKSATIKNKRLLTRFTNVYIQDSTCISLPDALRDNFRGNYSRGQIKAVAKLQVIFNLNRRLFSGISLTAYSRNDQTASQDIIPLLKKGDLVIRDMGYFVIGTLKKILEKKAEFISRLRADLSLFDARTGQQLHLARLLKHKTFLKRRIILGTSDQVAVTLIAIKADRPIHQHRKQQLLKDRDRRKKVTLERLYLLGWDIFICSTDELSGQEIKELYRLRWQIEIIFKSWKSNLKIEQSISAHLKKKQLFCAMIYLSLLMVIIVILPIYIHLQNTTKKPVSLLRLTQLLLTTIPSQKWRIELMTIQNLTYHANYDMRQRTNLVQKIQLLA